MEDSGKNMVINTGINLYYTDTGNAMPVMIFIHGLGTDHQCWKKLIPFFKTKYRCIAVDLPGYGHSSKAEYPFGISFFADTVHNFLTRMGIRTAIIAGHSMGGQIAMRFALDYPDTCSGLLLMAPAGIETFTEEGEQKIINWYRSENLQTISDRQIRKNFEANFFIQVPEFEEMIRERLEMKSDSKVYSGFCKMIESCVAAMIREPVYDELPALKMPVLVFFGRNDQLIPSPLVNKELTTADLAEKARKIMPASTIIQLENCGHFIPLEKPEEVLQASLTHFD